MKTARLVFFPIKISRNTRSEEERGRLPLTHTGGYFFHCRPEVHKAEFSPEPGIRVRRVSKKRRLHDNTVRGLKGREQFLYLHKKRANSVLGDLPKLVARDTGVATQKNNPKGIADQMPEPAKAFVGDREEPLARHEMSGQTEKPVSGHGSLRRERRTVIWHLAGSGIVVIQLCLGRTEASQTSRCRMNWLFPTRSSRSELTTSHVLRANDRRKRRFLLPISLPNPDFLRGRYTERAMRGAGGSDARTPGELSRSKITHKILL